MAQSPAANIRSTITDDEFGGFRITIPPGRGGGCLLGCVVSLWLVVAAYHGLHLASEVRLGRDHRERLSGFVAWLFVGGLLFLPAAFGTSRGEVIRIDEKMLIVRSRFLGYTRERAYELAGVRNLRALRSTDIPGLKRDSRMSAVAFDYDGQTHHFARGLSDEEVVRLARTIRQRFPIRDDFDDVEPLPVSS